VSANASQHGLVRVSLVVATGGFLFGYDTAVINGAIQYLSAHFGLNSVQEGLAGASAILGCIPGALMGGFICDKFGRRSALFLCAALFVASGIGSALPATFTEFLSARLVGGVAIGVASMACPVYISECAPAAQRGRLGVLFQLGIVVGIFLTLFLNSFIQGRGGAAWNTAYGWRWMLGSEAFPALILFCLLPSSPESPSWLIQKGGEPQVRETLGQSKNRATIETENAAVLADSATENGRLGELLERRFRRPLLIATGIAGFAQLSGINAVMYYSTKIFTTAGIGVRDAFSATVLAGFVNLCFTLVAIMFVDRAGRRSLLLVGLALQVLSLSMVAWALAAHSRGTALLLAILVFIASFAMALGPISWLLGSEILPVKIRARGMSVVAFTTWVGCYAVAQTFPMLIDSPAFGPAKTFCIYAAISLAGLGFTFFLVPETKGRTLDEIEASWVSPRRRRLARAPIIWAKK
jgi:MFS transporter, SP family, arabinose:H+ symporter